ncbi:hypothetical protein L6164_037657 [Bauhinia variegata]|uniref:Uncharacterized protein n=1 Tax=Bauhinia variegata TaxID=167791 RepID=A0ACB9KKJ7_BAUVA|nr:hypothetical protein L6164_037657 [Bauhinia variegata]
MMEPKREEIVIVGAGIAGLTTSLGLHRLGIRSLVLESSDTLRVTGFAITMWTNAWKALDAVGVGDILRQQHVQLHGNVTTSLITGHQTSNTSFNAKGKHGSPEVRCVRRKLLLEALANELPSGTIRYSSKVVAIEESSFSKLIHLADGTTIQAKVLIGCDGVNSVVAKWLGFKKAAFAGRSSVRGFAEFTSNHGFEPRFMQFFGDGCRSGALPCDEKTGYWFFTWTPTSQEKELEEDPAMLKQLMLQKLEKMPSNVRVLMEKTELESLSVSRLRYRHPWELIWGNISKGNVCIAGDAVHPMTPDLGQGGCCALEDGVVLARCLAEAFSEKPRDDEDEEKDTYKRIEAALKKYANERRWRSIDLITTAYTLDTVQNAGLIHGHISRSTITPEHPIDSPEGSPTLPLFEARDEVPGVFAETKAAPEEVPEPVARGKMNRPSKARSSFESSDDSLMALDLESLIAEFREVGSEAMLCRLAKEFGDQVRAIRRHYGMIHVLHDRVKAESRCSVEVNGLRAAKEATDEEVAESRRQVEGLMADLQNAREMVNATESKVKDAEEKISVTVSKWVEVGAKLQLAEEELAHSQSEVTKAR